jgi:hypothetical protein
MHLSWSAFYASTVVALSGIGMLITLSSAFYFHAKARRVEMPAAMPTLA